MIKKIIFCLIAITLISSFLPNKATAQTLNDIYNDLNKVEKKKSETEVKKQATQKEIAQVKQNINVTSKEIVQAEKDIVATKAEIIKINEKIGKKKEETKDIMRFFQVSNGQTDYLEYAFGAQSYEDFIYRLAVVEQMSEYNTNLLLDMNNLILENQSKQVELQSKQVDLAKKQVKMGKQLDSLGGELNVISEISVDEQAEIESIKKLISFYESQGCKRTDNVMSCVKIPADTGFRKPLTTGRVTSEFGYRCYTLNGSTKCDYHNGIDFGGNPEGVPVLSVANGTVAAIWHRSSCGGNTVFVHHNINGVAYTTQYTHLLAYNVSVGDAVASGTQIGSVGGGAQTQSYDKCTTGAHLHFAVGYGHYMGMGPYAYSNWSTYLGKQTNPRNILNLPALGVTWSGR